MTAVMVAWAVTLVETARFRLLTAEGESARRSGQWGKAVEAHLRAVALAETAFADSLEAAVAAQNLAMTFVTPAGSPTPRPVPPCARHCGGQPATPVWWPRSVTTSAAWPTRAVTPSPVSRGPAGRWRSAKSSTSRWHWPPTAAPWPACSSTQVSSTRRSTCSTAPGGVAAHLGADDYEAAVIDGNLATIALRRNDLPTAERRARAASASNGGSARPIPSWPSL